MEENEIYKIGERIAALRKQKGLTQRALAQKLFVTDRAVSRWETGYGFPEITILTVLASVLEVSVDELLGGKKLVLRDIDTDKINENFFLKKEEVKPLSSLKEAKPYKFTPSQNLKKFDSIRVEHTVYTIPLIVFALILSALSIFCSPIRYYAAPSDFHGEFVADKSFLVNIFNSFSDVRYLFDVHISDAFPASFTMLNIIACYALFVICLIALFKSFTLSNSYGYKVSLVCFIVCASNLALSAVFCAVYNFIHGGRVFCVGLNYILFTALTAYRLYLNVKLLHLGESPKRLKTFGKAAAVSLCAALVLSCGFNIYSANIPRAYVYRGILPQEEKNNYEIIYFYDDEETLRETQLDLSLTFVSNKPLNKIEFVSVITDAGEFSDTFLTSVEQTQYGIRAVISSKGAKAEFGSRVRFVTFLIGKKVVELEFYGEGGWQSQTYKE